MYPQGACGASLMRRPQVLARARGGAGSVASVDLRKKSRNNAYTRGSHGKHRMLRPYAEAAMSVRAVVRQVQRLKKDLFGRGIRNRSGTRRSSTVWSTRSARSSSELCLSRWARRGAGAE
jgi:hypothetical protein